jgi:hypothetical protein
MKVAYREFLKTIGLGLLAMVLAATSVYGFWWAERTMTYAQLCKELVEQTVADLIPEYLK